jgi:4-hydroxybenzoate polyprenyltransferase
LIRLTHPFPSVLDGLVVGVIAVVASGDPAAGLRLAGAMIALQVSIGALNDVVDAPRDAVGRTDKPIPAGLVSERLALGIVALGAIVGSILAVPSGLALAILGWLCLAIGYSYDLRLKGTPWSWLPFALGIPLLPIYGWFGAVGSVPEVFAILIPMAVLAGASLAIGNALADIDLDRASGTGSIAVELGPVRAWATGTVLLAIVTVVALGTLVVGHPAWLAILAAIVGAAIIGVGLALARPPVSETARVGWELQAIGVAVLAAAWLVGLVRAQ